MTLGHKVHKVEMKVMDSSRGVARFLSKNSKGVPLPFELGTTSKEFKNNKFVGFARGTTILATFRISEQGRRYLLNARPIAHPDGTPIGIEEAEEGARLEPSNIVADGFYYPLDVQRVFSIADTIAKKEGMVTLLMVGPSGYGKTMYPSKFAEKTGRDLVRVNCAAIRDPEEWMGFREAKDGSTVFDPSDFSVALEKGDTVIILDEVNRLEPWLHNTLFPLLDDDRSTVVHNQKFTVATNTVFVMTINRGLEFTGTFELDQAFLNRVYATIQVKAPPKDIEIEILKQRTGISKSSATTIIEVANQLREVVERGESDIDCSTRAVLRIALLTKHGLSPRAAFHDVIEASASDPEIRKKLTDVINSTMGVFSKIQLSRDESVFFDES
jgi:nitric oxide reductase NorQ protein